MYRRIFFDKSRYLKPKIMKKNYHRTKKCIRAWEKWNFGKSIKKEKVRKKTHFHAKKVIKQKLKRDYKKERKRKKIIMQMKITFFSFCTSISAGITALNFLLFISKGSNRFAFFFTLIQKIVRTLCCFKHIQLIT